MEGTAIRRVTRRSLLALAATAPLLAGCAIGRMYGAPGPLARGPRRVLLWHADAVPGERVFRQELLPRIAAARPGLEVSALAHGDPDDLVRRLGQAAAGGLGPDLFQAPGEWLPDLAARNLAAPLEGEAGRLVEPARATDGAGTASGPAGSSDAAGSNGSAGGWSPGLAETALWQRRPYGLPASVQFRQPFFNEELLRNAGLFSAGRTTPPSTWDELADVSKRVARPDERWGLVLPSYRGDEELYLHALQIVHTAGGELPRREGARVRLDVPPVREALQLLLDLVQKSGALPLDRQPFRLAEMGKAGLWWADGPWLGDQQAVGATMRVGAVPVPRNRRGGALLRSRHWCLGAVAGNRDDAAAVLAVLAEDEVSHRYCTGLSLPPARRANWEQPFYTQPRDRARPFDPAVWRAIVEQLGQADNRPLTTFPGYREIAGRLGGEMQLVLLGKKPIATALSEGEAGAAEILARTPA